MLDIKQLSRGVFVKRLRLALEMKSMSREVLSIRSGVPLCSLKQTFAGVMVSDARKAQLRRAFGYSVNDFISLWVEDLREIDLAGSDLSDTDLSGFDFTGSDLSWANLSRTNLTGAILSGVKFKGAHLIETNLSKVNLSKVDLSKANVIESYYLTELGGV
tara:strand:- start:199 stop:678 length:480 start_codon:yes stop_codon:yes gene_type:complete